MKDRIIASLVGGLIIFIWQFFSWTISGIHDGNTKYTPQQDALLSAISSQLKEEGMYLMPNLPKDASSDDMQKLEKEVQGKPNATVIFIPSYESNMVRSMIRGFLLDIFIVYLLLYIVTRGGTRPPFIRMIAASVSIGMFSWLWGPYMDHVWFQMPWSAISGHLIDAIGAWAICGIWLGWYMNRKRAVTTSAN